MRVVLPMSDEMKAGTQKYYDILVALSKVSIELKRLQAIESPNSISVLTENGPMMLDVRKLTQDEAEELVSETRIKIAELSDAA